MILLDKVPPLVDFFEELDLDASAVGLEGKAASGGNTNDPPLIRMAELSDDGTALLLCGVASVVVVAASARITNTPMMAMFLGEQLLFIFGMLSLFGAQ